MYRFILCPYYQRAETNIRGANVVALVSASACVREQKL